MENEKLRTLNDIEIWDKADYHKPVEERLFTGEILRAEAVKWVKVFEGKKHLFRKEAQNYDEVMASNQGKINIFKHFFNLTEADLEDRK